MVARSSAEAELRTTAHGICEALSLWMKMLAEDLEVKVEMPLKFHCDNKDAISISRKPVHHDRTKTRES